MKNKIFTKNFFLTCTFIATSIATITTCAVAFSHKESHGVEGQEEISSTSRSLLISGMKKNLKEIEKIIVQNLNNNEYDWTKFKSPYFLVNDGTIIGSLTPFPTNRQDVIIARNEINEMIHSNFKTFQSTYKTQYLNELQTNILKLMSKCK